MRTPLSPLIVLTTQPYCVLVIRPLWDSLLGSSPSGKQNWHHSMGRQECEQHSFIKLCWTKIATLQQLFYSLSQDYFQSATHRKVSEEYFGTVEKDTIRKLYQRWVKQYLRIKTLLTIIFFIKQQEPMVFCSGTNLTLSCLGTVLRITSKWGNQALKTLLKTQR